MTQRYLTYPITQKNRDVIIAGWDRPLSQLFLYAGRESWSHHGEFWCLGDQPLEVDAFVEVPDGHITPEHLKSFTKLIEEAHIRLRKPMCNAVVIKSLLAKLVEDSLEVSTSNTAEIHAVDGLLID